MGLKWDLGKLKGGVGMSFYSAGNRNKMKFLEAWGEQVEADVKIGWWKRRLMVASEDRESREYISQLVLL